MARPGKASSSSSSGAAAAFCCCAFILRHELRLSLGRGALQRAHQRQHADHQDRRLPERPGEALARRARRLADDLLVEAGRRLEAVARPARVVVQRRLDHEPRLGSRDLPFADDVVDLLVREPAHVRVEGAAEGRDQDRHADRHAELARRVENAGGEAHLGARHGAHRAHVQRREADAHSHADQEQAGQDAQVAERVVGRRRHERDDQHADRHGDQARLRELAGCTPVRRAAHERPHHEPHQRHRGDGERGLELGVAPEVHEQQREQEQRADRARRRRTASRCWRSGTGGLRTAPA